MHSANASVTINGSTVEIERDGWDVLMVPTNRLLDTGDIVLLDATIGRALLAKAKMANGALYLMAHGRTPRERGERR